MSHELKIGVLTYHRAVNYGARLQAYALQEVLRERGYKVEFIDYYQSPDWFKIATYMGKTFASTRARLGIIWFYLSRTRKLNDFLNYLEIGNRRYRKLTELKKNPPNYHIYVCGSDQIWNCHWNGDETYFLDFGDAPRFSYAPSFGLRSLPRERTNNIRCCLERFVALSVREQSGCSILAQLGLKADCVLDPTLLLNIAHYLKIAETCEMKESPFIFSMLLHRKQFLPLQTLGYIRKISSHKVVNVAMDRRVADADNRVMSVQEWIACISQSSFVVTNSFHAVVFAVLFHKPFIGIAVEGGLHEMNERLLTLLTNLNLVDRFVTSYDESNISAILQRSIDWESVDKTLSDLKIKSLNYLDNALHLAGAIYDR